MFSNAEGLNDSSQNVNVYKFLSSFKEADDGHLSGSSQKIIFFKISDFKRESLQEKKQIDNAYLV